MFSEKIVKNVVSVYFMAVAFMMYFFINEAALIGGVGFSYRHLFALLLVISAFLYFLVSPNVTRGWVAVKSSFVYSVPLFVVLGSSLLVWMIEKSSLVVINRGLSISLFYYNWMSCAFAAGALLYVFGEAGIWYNLLAIVLSNLVMIFRIMVEDGIGVFFKELWELIVSFADVTGSVIVKAEIHELAFCLGAYIIYMLFKPKKKVWFWALFAGAAFCFICAMKRIAFIAILGALAFRVLFWLFGKFSAKAVKRAVTVTMILSCVIMLFYVFLIKMDVFSMIEEAGIDTSGRAKIYQAVSGFYDFKPSFIGRGIGFLTYQLNNVISLGVDAIHNDFLQFFIDLGFWGFILWMLSMTVLRTAYFGRKGNTDAAIISCLLLVYLLIVSSTDNTINYPLVMTTLGIIMMGHNFDKQVEQTRILQPGEKYDEDIDGE